MAAFMDNDQKPEREKRSNPFEDLEHQIIVAEEGLRARATAPINRPARPGVARPR